MEKRRIIKNSPVEYEVLKPSVFGNNNETWERKGRKYDLRGLCSLLKSNQFEVYIPPENKKEILKDIRRYKREQKEKHQNYASKQGLEGKAQSKTI